MRFINFTIIRKPYLLAILIVFSLSSFSFSQACGTGINRLNFSNRDAVEYIVLPVVPKNRDYHSEEFKTWLSKIFFPKENVEKRFFCCSMLKVETGVAEKFLKNQNIEDFQAVLNPKSVKNKISGEIHNGFIEFKTLETLSQPVMFKISSRKHGNFYYLGVLFGGCHREQFLF